MAKKATRIRYGNGTTPTISRVNLLMTVFEYGLRLEKGRFNWKKFLRAKACRMLSPAERKELRTKVCTRFVAYHDALARKSRSVDFRKAPPRGD